MWHNDCQDLSNHLPTDGNNDTLGQQLFIKLKMDYSSGVAWSYRPSILLRNVEVIDVLVERV